MDADGIDFSRLLASRCACPRCGASELTIGVLCRVFAGEGEAPSYDRTTRCETCALVWIEQLHLVGAYAIDLRDKRRRSATVLYLTINNDQAVITPPSDDAA